MSDEFIIEFTRIGNFVKVIAVCTTTFQETSIVGDPKYSDEYLSNLAIRKLKNLLVQKNNNNS